MRRFVTLAVFLVIAALLPSVARLSTSARAQPAASTPLLPTFLPDVEAQFAALSLRPDGLAFDIGDSPDPRLCKHYQGIARVNGPDGTPYVFVSRSGNQPGGIGAIACPFEDDDPGNLLVVRLGSRDTTGERLRSNRFQRGWPINGDLLGSVPPTPPDARDRVVTTISFDGNAWDNYAHPGGMQVIGDVLVLAMETPYDDDLPENVFMFIDVSNPENPELLSSWEPPDPGSDFSAGLVGITAVRNADGSCCGYVMVATGQKNKDVRFFRSVPTEADGSTDLRSQDLEWEQTGRFSEGEIEACLNVDVVGYPIISLFDWHTGGGDAHQSLNFVRQGGLDGPLYMIGARNDTPLPSGDDRMDLYRIYLDDAGVPQDCFIELVDTTHFHSDPYMGGGDSANFAAASGVYVSPSAELIVYAAEYENDGPVGVSGKRTVRFGEYRHRNMVRPDSPTLRPSIQLEATSVVVDEGSTATLLATGSQARTKAWIQTFEDDGAGGSLPGVFDSDEWLAVDYIDRDADDFDDFGALRAGGALDENAGSWRWFAPTGCTIRANDFSVAGGGDPGPDTKILSGTGSVVVETDLDDIGFDDDMGSVTFLPNCNAYYGVPIGVDWDLDDDGTFETAGTSVPFDATFLDGPAELAVAARAQHPTDTTALGTSAPVALTVNVRNVAPFIETLDVVDGAGNSLLTDVPIALVGLPVTLSATFTDPGVADTQTASIDWDDATVDTTFDSFGDASGGVTGTLVHSHAYTQPGSYVIELTIADDDGGTTTANALVEVVSVEDALEIVAEILEAEVATATDPVVAGALQLAIDWLIGNNGGRADNGAVDALDAEDPVSAITHLAAAIKAIETAEASGGPDLAALKDLLGLAAEALAVAALADAAAAVEPPSRGEQRQLATIQVLIDRGHALLLASLYADALDAYKRAVARALRLTG